MQPSVGEQGRIRIWVVLVVVVFGLAAIATRDLWLPETNAARSGSSTPGPGKPELTTYRGTKQFAMAGADTQDSLAAVWEEALVKAGMPFRKPGFKAYDPEYPPRDPCTRDKKDWVYEHQAYYCSSSQTIYWDDQYWEDLYDKYGSTQTLLLFAHEWGHHISYLRGDHLTFSVRKELQADCFAGLYFRRAFRSLALGPSSKVRSAVSEWFHRGDRTEAPRPWFEPGVHGRAWQRTSVFSLGFSLNNLRLCERVEAFNSRNVGRVGPVPVAVVEGSDIETVDRRHIHITSEKGEADVRYLETAPGTSLAEACELYSRTVQSSGGDGSDIELRPLPNGRSEPSGWLAWSQVRYERSQVRDGRPEISHGVVLLAVLKKGGMVAFDTNDAGPASSVQEATWKRMSVYVNELFNGTAWEFG